MKHIDSAIFSVLLISAYALSTLIFYCYFGKVATDSFLQMADCLYDVNWHKLPVKTQKYFIIMIGNAQKPLNYHGFGVAVLNLETFSKVNELFIKRNR